jgi:hypothetical protein
MIMINEIEKDIPLINIFSWDSLYSSSYEEFIIQYNPYGAVEISLSLQ